MSETFEEALSRTIDQWGDSTLLLSQSPARWRRLRAAYFQASGQPPDATSASINRQVFVRHAFDRELPVDVLASGSPQAAP